MDSRCRKQRSDASAQPARRTGAGADDDLVFDRETALGRIGGDRQALGELAELFLEECPRMLGALDAAVERRDAKAVEHAAHKLKSAVANFFAKTTLDAAVEMEALGRSGDLSGAESSRAALQHALQALQTALQGLG